jgi:hypothetical protein
MKVHLTDIITRPEPSASPFATLFFALLGTAGVSIVSTLIIIGVSHA